MCSPINAALAWQMAPDAHAEGCRNHNLVHFLTRKRGCEQAVFSLLRSGWAWRVWIHHTSTNKEISDSKNVDMKHEIGCFQTCWRVLAIDRHDQIWSGRWFWWFQSDMGNLPGISWRFSDQNSYKVSWAHPRWHSPEMVFFRGWVYWVSLSVSRSFKIDWDASLDLSWFDLFPNRKCSKHMANA